MTMGLHLMEFVPFTIIRQLNSLCEKPLKMIFNDLFAPTPKG